MLAGEPYCKPSGQRGAALLSRPGKAACGSAASWNLRYSLPPDRDDGDGNHVEI